MKKILYTFILVAAVTTTYAQNLVDALRLSEYQIQGTARSTAMGNAFGALGADFTSASINPAGMGLYRSSEFVLTTQLGKNEVDASYLGTMASDSKFNISIPNIGYVINFPSAPNSTSSLVSFSMGIGYNRMNNFNANKLVMGNGATSSMLDQFAVNADNGIIDEAYEDLAIGTDLIYNYDWDSRHYHDMLINNPRLEEVLTDPDFDPENLENIPHNQRKTFAQKGSMDEYTISFAANFNHKVYLGATIGIHDVYFKENANFTESNVDYENGNLPAYILNNNLPAYLNEYEFNSYLKTTGSGFNFKIGAIFKPVDELRLGVAFHSPTFYDLHDSFDNNMYSNIDYLNDAGTAYDNVISEAWSPYYDYDYRLETPMKGILSAAYVIGKAGLISVDYEYVDYSTIKLRDGGDGYNFLGENQEIKEAYKAVGNLRIGGEYRVNNFFSLRGGYEYLPSPFESEAFGASQKNTDANTSTYAAGFGIKSGGFFFDMACKHIEKSSYLELYQVPESVASPMAKFDHQHNNITFTLGFRF